MSHQIARVNGKDSFMSKRQMPWHMLGQIVDKDVNSSEAIKLAGLDYEVKKGHIFVQRGDIHKDEFGWVEPQAARQRHYGGHFVNYRSDTNQAFGIVGPGYEIIQNTEAFEFFDKILGHNNIYYETAGALKNGAVVFISAKVPQELMVAGKDVVDQYLLLTNSHDGSSAIKVLFTPVRVVCNNTLQLALGKFTNSISLRHTRNVRDQLDNAHKVLGFARKASDIALEHYNQLANVQIKDKQLRDYIDHVFPNISKKEEISTRLLNIRKDVLNYTLTGFGQQEIEGTWWWAYNGVTGYFQNVKKMNKNDMMSSNIMGANANTMRSALTYALKQC